MDLLGSKNMSIESQSQEVRKVKRSESGMILDPITISSDKTIREALDIMALSVIDF